jgi:hypothetical protein
MPEQRLFIITRKDISSEQQAVQSTHAACEWMKAFYTSSQTWQNGTLVQCAVSDLRELESLFLLLRDRLYMFSIFTEPDINNELTAIACLISEDDKIFNSLPLLKFS